jgi:hypothetical protein
MGDIEDLEGEKVRTDFGGCWEVLKDSFSREDLRIS